MRLAHLTDLHLPIPSRPALGELVNKRALGYLSWARNRKFRHTLAALEAIVADCHASRPDFTTLSGDLVNISLESEFIAAKQWVARAFEESAAGFVPGNHDTYVRLCWPSGAGAFDRFMVGSRFDDPAERPPHDETDFPFVRIVGEVGLIFANSSPSTAPGLATGRLGATQLARIGRELERLKAAGKCRVLVLHHPVTKGATPRRKALDDGSALRALIADKGVDLVLHGHTHRSIWAEVETPEGARPVVGGASASHPKAHGKYRPARYNLFSIECDGDAGWAIDVTVRELDPESGAVITAEQRRLLPIPT